MKPLIYMAMMIVLSSIAYAGWGDEGWGDCTGGWGVCTAASSSSTSSPEGGGGSSSGGYTVAASNCAPYAYAYNTCYWYNPLTRQCIQGCQQGQSCNGIVCENSTSLQVFSSASFTFWDKMKSLWQKLNIFSTQSSLSALELPASASQTTLPTAQPSAESNTPTTTTPQTPMEWVNPANPYAGLLLLGIILTILAIFQFGSTFMLTPPYAFFFWVYWVLFIIILKFKLFGG